MKVIGGMVQVNEGQIRCITVKIPRGACGELAGKTMGVSGLCFKPNTDEIRDTPSLSILSPLQQGGAQVKAYDPVTAEAAGPILRDVTPANTAYEGTDGSDVLVVPAKWDGFRELVFFDIKDRMRLAVLADPNHIYDPAATAGTGFTYEGAADPCRYLKLRQMN